MARPQLPGSRGGSFVPFQGGFRLLFLGGALWALVVLLLWLGALMGTITLPSAMPALAWHQHEMLFGYLGAIIAGFLTAAVPNWTQRPVATGGKVTVFVLLWLAARLAILFSAWIPPVIGAVLDVGFLLLLFAYVTGEIFAADNDRNKLIPLVLLLFAIANGLDHAGAMGLLADPAIGMRGGFALILLLIAIIGGRIVPAFTRNWLTRQEPGGSMPVMGNRFDLAMLVVTALTLMIWIARPVAEITGVSLLVTGILHLARLARWAGWRTLSDPMVFVLHIAYAWLGAGFLLLGAANLWPGIPVSSAMHALSAGAMAVMTLAVMTRATRGHTGRPLRADAATVAIYLLVNIGALLRVTAPWLPIPYLPSLHLSGTLWGGAFLLFAFVYGPMLLRPRVDGRA
ncbi:MAG: NnrS family protein [Sphingomonadaceae bacterium]